MLPIVGYTNKLTAEPGESIDVMVSSFGAASYHADFRQIIQGDTNPEGPGYKDKLIDLDLGGAARGYCQAISPRVMCHCPRTGSVTEYRRFHPCSCGETHVAGWP